MATCTTCNEDFRPLSSAWPEAICGECIALHIELLLMRALMMDDPKPMRRAVRDQDIDLRVEEVKRQA